MQNIKGLDCVELLQSAIINDCEEIVSVKDLNLNYISCNKAFLNMFDFCDFTQVVNKQINQVFNKHISQIIKANSQIVISTLESNSFIITVDKDNHTRVIKVTTYPVIQNDVISALLSISRDITHEENIKLKLIEKICMINSLLEYMPMLVYMKDINNVFLSGSKYSKQFINQGIDCYSDSITLDLDDVFELINSNDEVVVKNKESVVFEKKVKSTDGDFHWYKIYKAPIYDVNSKINGIVSIFQNIDVEKQLDIQKELFLATLTHDLKTPLQAQISSLKLLSKGSFGNINQSQKEVIDMVIESAGFMNEMLYSILFTYKYENGLMRLDKQNFNIDSLIKICLKEAYHLAKDKNIEFEYKIVSKNLIINADENQIRRVFANILNNAINYAYKNTKIIISISDDNDIFRMKIKNTSEPIPDNIKMNMFDKYISGSQVTKKIGIGLGLYFCKKVVDAHNGRIFLNGIDTSNEFVIELPKLDNSTNCKELVFV